jgi:hypothetical protein
MYRRIEACRICGNRTLELVLDLGEQMLTGVFPRRRDASVTVGPLRLVKCTGEPTACGLLQLEHSYDPDEMYGENYGYRSGLNASMVAHLQAKVARILARQQLGACDLVIDIGSNDGTTLRAYGSSPATLVGIDPTAEKFRQYYPTNVQVVPSFFSSSLVHARFPGRRAKVITSFSMLYDLEQPLDFMREVHECLADDGIWVFEQSYMPTMLEMNAYDTVCHEHLEYYGLEQIKWMTSKVGFVILDVEFNDVNGGSFSVTVAKASGGAEESPILASLLEAERLKGLGTLAPFRAFADRVAASRTELRQFVQDANRAGKSVAALGASTKGNVVLQYCGLSSTEVRFIGEVNPEKFGRFSPGTWIPIIAEDELLAFGFDYLIVLPWHFRKFFLSNQKWKQVNLVFPLPNLEVVGPARCD